MPFDPFASKLLCKGPFQAERLDTYRRFRYRWRNLTVPNELLVAISYFTKSLEDGG